MANMTWGDVLLTAAVATVGFTLLSWWFSAVMARRGWTWQAKNRPPKTRPGDARDARPGAATNASGR